jgi:hypothetical protein
MRIRLIPILTLLLAAAAPAAAQETQALRSDAGFTLELPAAWRRMDDAELEAVRGAMTRSGRPITYDAAFDLTRPRSPRAMVVVGRVPVGQRITLRDFAAAFQQGQAEERRQAAAAGRAPDPANATSWDEENGIGWVRSALPAGNGPPAFSLSAGTLTPSGDTMITLVFFGPESADESRVRAELLAALRTMRAN